MQCACALLYCHLWPVWLTIFFILTHKRQDFLKNIEHKICILIIKPTTFTNFSNLFLDWNSTCFGQFLCPSSGIWHCTNSKRYMSYRFWCLLASGIRILTPLASSHQNLYDTYHCCVYSKKTPDNGQRNCPKHVEFYSKNKFEILVHLVGFIVRICHDARSPECQKWNMYFDFL